MAYDNLMAKNLKYKEIMSDVLQHGDTWMNNILFEKKEDGTFTDKVAAFIDWQICKFFAEPAFLFYKNHSQSISHLELHYL